VKLSHIITIVVALLLIGVLYFFGDITPSKSAVSAAQGDGHSEGDGHVHAASWDSIYVAARSRMAEHALQDIEHQDQKVFAAGDSSAMVPAFDSLTKIWIGHRELLVGAYYQMLSAKLVNSEKKLNFAAQFFLELLQLKSIEPGERLWCAQQAISGLSKSLELNPNNDTTQLALAVAYIEGTGETMSGVQELLTITRENPNHIAANLMLGQMSIQSGQFDKAVGRLETILKQEPNNREALFFLAEAYKGLGDKAKAISILEKVKAIVNNPDFSKDIDDYIKTF